MKISKDKLLILSFIALIVLGWIITFTQRNTSPSKAAGANPVTISMSAPQNTFPANQEQIITVTINTGDQTKKISAFDMTFNATGNLTITGSTPPTAIGGTTLNVNEFVRTITNTQAHLAYAFINPDADLSSAISFQVKVTGAASGSGSFSLDLVHSQVVGNIVANTFDLPGSLSPLSFTIGTGTGATPTPTVVPGTPQIQVRIAPPTGTQALNNPFTVSLIIDGQQTGQKISAFDIKLNANPNILKINSVSEAFDQTGSTAKYSKLTNSFNATTGEILLNYISINAEADLPTLAKVDINLIGIANGTGTLAISTAQVTGNIVENAFTPVLTSGIYSIGNVVVTGNPTPTITGNLTPTVTITVNPSPTPTISITTNPTPTGAFPSPTTTITTNPTPTVTPTIPTGKTVLNMKLKFQGITKQPQTQYNSMKVQVMVGKDGFLSAPQVGTFTADAGGVWNGTVAFNDVPAGAGYRVYFKGPKHLQKKLCEASPVETAAGTYRCADGKITIKDGQNTLDFSKVYAMVGDLPDQNGVVDSYDTSYIKLNLGSSDPKVLQVADLNLDGIVDTQDYSLVIASLSIKYDDL